MTMRAVVIGLALLWATAPVLASFDVEVPLEGAYGYDATTCTATGSIDGGRVVPRCTDTGSTGTFLVRLFSHVVGSAAVFTVDSVRGVNITEPGASDVASLTVECTAFPPGANGVDTVTWGTAAAVSVDLHTAATNADIKDSWQSGASSATAIWDRATGADCASTTCNDSDVVCRVSYKSGDANVTTTEDFSSMKLTVGP